MIENMLQSLTRISLLALLAASPPPLMAADQPAIDREPKASAKEPSLPPIIGALPQSPNAAFHYSAWQDGIRIGISSESTEYALNHRINVWECVESQHPEKAVHSLMVNDPIYKDGSLRITGPDGKTRSYPISGPIDGPPGGWMGGESGNLHDIIRVPGKYTLQLVLGKRKTDPISFTVLP